jgi:hypothetical protein
MDKLLLQLLERLEAIGEHHGELFDTEVRESMGIAIMQGFVANSTSAKHLTEVCTNLAEV